MMTRDTHAVAATIRGDDDDRWYEWLQVTRHGGDGAYAAALQPLLDDIRERVLDHAALTPGAAVADIGCGDGATGLGALRRAPGSTVAFADISPALIELVRRRAADSGWASRCTFAVAPAEQLTPLPAASFDVVLVRAVLAYVADRAAALRECRRLLRRGGRLSIAEPIFADQAYAVAGMAVHLASAPDTPATRALRLLHRVRAAQYPSSAAAIAADPLVNYNERDLLSLVEAAGFVNVHLRLHIDRVPALPMAWRAFLRSSPRAGVPVVDAILARDFGADERAEFERFVRPLVETGAMIERNVNAFLFADAP
jgi:ubiquinone/menaquinone biosynthesis C-methylase UbiE